MKAGLGPFYIGDSCRTTNEKWSTTRWLQLHQFIWIFLHTV